MQLTTQTLRKVTQNCLRPKIRSRQTFIHGMTPFSTRFINCETGKRYRYGATFCATRSFANSNKTQQLDFHKKVWPRRRRQSRGIRLARNTRKKWSNNFRTELSGIPVLRGEILRSLVIEHNVVAKMLKEKKKIYIII